MLSDLFSIGDIFSKYIAFIIYEYYGVYYENDKHNEISNKRAKQLKKVNDQIRRNTPIIRFTETIDLGQGCFDKKEHIFATHFDKKVFLNRKNNNNYSDFIHKKYLI